MLLKSSDAKNVNEQPFYELQQQGHVFKLIFGNGLVRLWNLVGATILNPLDDYKKIVVSIIKEYFSIGDVEVATSDLRELGSTEYHSYFIKRLISMAIEMNDKEKEMVSDLDLKEMKKGLTKWGAK
ncbi:unnamed protein product [Dovyalis caffra]|uniref:MI domain-containing protein n=1 Tax=Dovyalis caffra TaxID=77055 RepID=A0AAV1SJF7_9ROSI|nr:unnamed protein product [Dovyalis caffra]